MFIRVLIGINVCDLDVELNIFICAEAYKKDLIVLSFLKQTNGTNLNICCFNFKLENKGK